MQSNKLALGIVAIATALTLTTGPSAVAASKDIPRGELDPLADQSDAGDVVEVASSIHPQLRGAVVEDTGTVSAGGQSGVVSVRIPRDAQRGIDLETPSGESVTIGLPFADSSQPSAPGGDGPVAYDNENGTLIVPAVHVDGTLEIATVVESIDAPTEYRYTLDLPDGATLVAHDGSAMAVDREGSVVAVFEAPVAVDAEGQPIGTSYRIDGDSLVQTVSHDDEATYPVVTTVASSYTIYYSRSDVEEMYDVLVTTGEVCGIPGIHWAISWACRPPADLAEAIRSAHYQKKRIKAVYKPCGYNYCNSYDYYVVN